jgi:hypothetical protein
LKADISICFLIHSDRDHIFSSKLRKLTVLAQQACAKSVFFSGKKMQQEQPGCPSVQPAKVKLRQNQSWLEHAKD